MLYDIRPEGDRPRTEDEVEVPVGPRRFLRKKATSRPQLASILGENRGSSCRTSPSAATGARASPDVLIGKMLAGNLPSPPEPKST
jgi:hypothetical protein